MKKIIDVYVKNKNSIENYLNGILKNFTSQPTNKEGLMTIFRSETSVEIIYTVDFNFIQLTPSYGRNYEELEKKGIDKTFYFKWVDFLNEDIHVSNPYIHYKTGRPTLTVAKKEKDFFLVVDFDLIKLLEALKLIEHSSVIDRINTTVTSATGIILGIIAIFLIIYGAYTFITMLFNTGSKDVLHEIFSSVISITIGIAIYDLAKTLCENEVLYKKFNKDETDASITLTKFINSIIIALSIESLMFVFKIVLDDASKTVNAMYLLSSVTLLIVGTGVYTYLVSKAKK